MMKLPLIFLLLFIGLLSFANCLPDETNDHNHGHRRHHIGAGINAVSFGSENNLATGVHIHYSWQLSRHSPFSLGIGYEAILDEHTHNTATVLLGYEIGHINISAGPGFTFAKEDGDSHRSLSGHLELMYEFTVGNFHLGPMAGFGFDGEESHISAGIHMGFGL